MVVAIAEADRAEHLVDVGTVYRNVAQWIWCAWRLRWVWPIYHECKQENGNTRGRHGLYHGHFRAGQYNEGTSHSLAVILAHFCRMSHVKERWNTLTASYSQETLPCLLNTGVIDNIKGKKQEKNTWMILHWGQIYIDVGCLIETCTFNSRMVRLMKARCARVDYWHRHSQISMRWNVRIYMHFCALIKPLWRKFIFSTPPVGRNISSTWANVIPGAIATRKSGGLHPALGTPSFSIEWTYCQRCQLISAQGSVSFGKMIASIIRGTHPTLTLTNVIVVVFVTPGSTMVALSLCVWVVTSDLLCGQDERHTGRRLQGPTETKAMLQRG